MHVTSQSPEITACENNASAKIHDDASRLTPCPARPARSFAWASCSGYVTSVEMALAAAPSRNASWLGNPTEGRPPPPLPPAPPPPLFPTPGPPAAPVPAADIDADGADAGRGFDGGVCWRCWLCRRPAACLSASYATNCMMGFDTRTRDGAAPDQSPARPSWLNGPW